MGLIPGVRAADAAWLDIENRIQYGYYTEDGRSLRNLMEPLVSGDQRDRLRSYYTGLLAYRLTLLATAEPAATGGKPPADSNKAEARQMTERCVASLDHALELQSDFADALALRSACLGRLAERNSWKASLAASRSSAQIHKALQLAPKNPRVLLLDAVANYEHSRLLGGEGRDSCGRLQRAVAAFEAERTDVDQVPGWGAAEAYVWLARCYLSRDDALAARDALERALLIAPPFAEARRLLARITSD
ncbi:MAG: Conserved hypohtetical protein rane, containing tetratricopeptide repeat domain [Gammaproteobacteria bacterium]|nr:Conserved hypohtetical protein rane, containing tetratricopeptide repeat domain [Gammaproteobacteria bacterium]